MMKTYFFLNKQHWIPNIGTVLMVILVLVTHNAIAAPNHESNSQEDTLGMISYQGNLVDAFGNPISGSMDMTFKLYAQPEGGTALWAESHVGANAVPVSSGLFNINLGSILPIPSAVWQNPGVYLGIQVGSDSEMTPRQLLSGVPYALSVPELSIGTTQLANASVTSEKLANDSINASKLDLQYGTVCLTETKEINLPGDWQGVIIPEFNLPMTLERSSRVLVWISGLAMYTQSSNGEVGLHLTINDVTTTACYSEQMGGWWNLDKSKIVNLGPGQYMLQVKAVTDNSGTLSVHGGGGWQTCVNYLVIDED